MKRIFPIVILLALISACQSQNNDLITINGLTMGTTYTVKLKQEDASPGKDRIHTDIEAILGNINNSMSTYIKDSELSRLNHSNLTDCQAISDDLYTVIEHAIEVSELSDGAFDVTVGPLVNLWGFGPDPFDLEVPADHEIALIKNQVGYEKINLNSTGKRISKSDPRIYIDLSGIAKGYAVDKIAAHLDKFNIQHYLVDIGGEIIARGTNNQQQVWQIGIEQADSTTRLVQRIIGLDNIAMATSGDYRNYFEKDGVRYSHTINPVTGKPIIHSLASVTVLDRTTMHADALATAFMVLGPDKTLTIANKLKIPVFMIVKTNNGFEEKYNDYFKPYFLIK
ncbi:MAG: FAD:protein FMN transferase [Proteobacteria bacterium]|nr:FAD:protein FMN transferase [Pseudomonadota bacterium]